MKFARKHSRILLLLYFLVVILHVVYTELKWKSIGRNQIQLDTSYLLLAPEIDSQEKLFVFYTMKIFLSSHITFTG